MQQTTPSKQSPIRYHRSLRTSDCTCRALWLVSMPCFLRQARPRASGELPTFQSDVAPLSMTHWNNREQKKGALTIAKVSWWDVVPAWLYAPWAHHASSCRLDHGGPEGFLFHRWMWQRCLFSTRQGKHGKQQQSNNDWYSTFVLVRLN